MATRMEGFGVASWRGVLEVIDVEAETDGLYQLPLAEFVAARNALAARLKTGGDQEGAAQVRALARPNVSAWAANHAYWTARGEFDAFVLSTRRLLRAQAEGVAGAGLRDTMKVRREAQGAVMQRVESLLVAAGHGVNPDTLRRVLDTFEALAVEAAGSEGARVRPGRLTGHLAPPGFEAITALGQDLSSLPPLDVRPIATKLVDAEPPAAALERAREALAEAERSLEGTRREAREAAAARSLLEGRAQAARDEVVEAGRRLDGARDRAALAADAEAVAREKADRLATASDAAEAARDAALRSLRDLE
jgi:hypothetical protein